MKFKVRDRVITNLNGTSLNKKTGTIKKVCFNDWDYIVKMDDLFIDETDFCFNESELESLRPNYFKD